MTREEWQEKVDSCTDEQELKYLLAHKPKGVKAIKTGLPVYVSEGIDTKPLLSKLRNGGK